MPWKETCPMDQRVEFIADYLDGSYTKKDLCMFYGISRPTGEWIARFLSQGAEGCERSRRPHRFANSTTRSPSASWPRSSRT